MYYLPQETGNYSVAGFRMIMERKVSHYVITYYIPSGLFVVVSWASFLIPCDDIQVRYKVERYLTTRVMIYAETSMLGEKYVLVYARIVVQRVQRTQRERGASLD